MKNDNKNEDLESILKKTYLKKLESFQKITFQRILEIESELKKIDDQIYFLKKISKNEKTITIKELQAQSLELKQFVESFYLLDTEIRTARGWLNTNQSNLINEALINVEILKRFLESGYFFEIENGEIFVSYGLISIYKPIKMVDLDTKINHFFTETLGFE